MVMVIGIQSALDTIINDELEHPGKKQTGQTSAYCIGCIHRYIHPAGILLGVRNLNRIFQLGFGNYCK